MSQDEHVRRIEMRKGKTRICAFIKKVPREYQMIGFTDTAGVLAVTTICEGFPTRKKADRALEDEIERLKNEIVRKRRVA